MVTAVGQVYAFGEFVRDRLIVAQAAGDLHLALLLHRCSLGLVLPQVLKPPAERLIPRRLVCDGAEEQVDYEVLVLQAEDAVQDAAEHGGATLQQGLRDASELRANRVDECGIPVLVSEVDVERRLESETENRFGGGRGRKLAGAVEDRDSAVQIEVGAGGLGFERPIKKREALLFFRWLPCIREMDT
jgi:hypothetical protein